MAATDITITNPNVNSGTPVVIMGATFTLGWKNMTKLDPVEGKYDITEAHYGGIENPIIVITGIMDADNVLIDVLTHKLLVDFAMIKSGVTNLKISLGDTPLVIGGQPSGGYKTDGTNTLDTTNGLDVQLKSFSIKSSTDIEHGQRVNISLTFQETG